ncbi:hypothetical protein [Desulfofundulus thermobenzoicus]|uniref:hypothetical protein n=1 Tax=Desulfofundulus thermobenzoicus TaxID=29376 RepID=UPI001883E9D5
MKVWFVEDAGGGCRAFSEVVVLVCENPLKKYVARVPLTWNTRESLEEVVLRLMIDLMYRAGVSREDRILVCSGNIFHAFHRWLTEKGYNWEYARMEGLAHDIAEDEFQRQITAAGFPRQIHLVERNYRDFYRQVEKWVMQQPEPQRFLKDREVRQKPVETRYTLKSNYARTRRCSTCRKPILPFTPMVEYRATREGKRIRHYYHPSCSPVRPLKNKLLTGSAQWADGEVRGIIIPCRVDSPCHWCDRIIPAGETAFYGYAGDKLLTGHMDCCQPAINGRVFFQEGHSIIKRGVKDK